MIRLSKPVQVLEWGLGTNTTNQNWTEIAKGRFAGRPKRKDGVTTLVVEVEGSLQRKNDKNEYVKVMQQGEGMTPRSVRWGEVAMGSISAIKNEAGKTVLEISVPTATKVGD
ncbi:MAG: hypothetical protein JSS86_08205 [Cyanobacteria bacterium SZAS LIN-2]|nr:hypothetical protein [Cyanobacteria bacterium SZAS LIN-3]MBS1996277.1 hypothetical protein [Cyanobacteria bacterium SZAS LIN-2]MBS2006743.1 hypothetical protein [Cyanobacteria bacterium SZAS TMP-1]